MADVLGGVGKQVRVEELPRSDHNPDSLRGTHTDPPRLVDATIDMHFAVDLDEDSGHCTRQLPNHSM